ncbi:MAG: thiocyanate hydrolase [Mycobacterium sp.]|nr:thiocyanate hydrolase [Mycobacterium sp.]
MAAKHSVDDPLPPWKTSLDGTLAALDRAGADAVPARPAGNRYADLPYAESRLITLATTLLAGDVITEADLRHKLATVRARLEA